MDMGRRASPLRPATPAAASGTALVESAVRNSERESGLFPRFQGQAQGLLARARRIVAHSHLSTEGRQAVDTTCCVKDLAIHYLLTFS